ncbi:hypothetical protein HK096_006703, partial [Nowakowskiella sp. JEL0078]
MRWSSIRPKKIKFKYQNIKPKFWVLLISFACVMICCLVWRIALSCYYNSGIQFRNLHWEICSGTRTLPATLKYQFNHPDLDESFLTSSSDNDATRQQQQHILELINDSNRVENQKDFNNGENIYPNSNNSHSEPEKNDTNPKKSYSGPENRLPKTTKIAPPGYRYVYRISPGQNYAYAQKREALKKQISDPTYPSLDSNNSLLIPFSKLKKIPHIVELHRKDTSNIGDSNSSPFKYFPELTSNFIKFSVDIGNPYLVPSLRKANSTLPIIVGGGGLIGCMRAWDYNTKNLARISKNVIGWGIGFNMHKDLRYNFVETRHLKKFALLGIRDVIAPYRWVPCASAMHPLLLELRDAPIVRKVGFFVHKNYPFVVKNGSLISVNGYIYKKRVPFVYGNWTTNSRVNAMKNDGHSIESVLNFISGCEVLVTSSYHGMYWATLMGKKVILNADFSVKFMYFPWPARKYSGHLQKDVNAAVSYPDALNQSRKANLLFYEDNLVTCIVLLLVNSLITVFQRKYHTTNSHHNFSRQSKNPSSYFLIVFTSIIYFVFQVTSSSQFTTTDIQYLSAASEPIFCFLLSKFLFIGHVHRPTLHSIETITVLVPVTIGILLFPVGLLQAQLSDIWCGLLIVSAGAAWKIFTRQLLPSFGVIWMVITFHLLAVIGWISVISQISLFGEDFWPVIVAGVCFAVVRVVEMSFLKNGSAVVCSGAAFYVFLASLEVANYFVFIYSDLWGVVISISGLVTMTWILWKNKSDCGISDDVFKKRMVVMPFNCDENSSGDGCNCGKCAGKPKISKWVLISTATICLTGLIILLKEHKVIFIGDSNSFVSNSLIKSESDIFDSEHLYEDINLQISTPKIEPLPPSKKAHGRVKIKLSDIESGDLFLKERYEQWKEMEIIREIEAEKQRNEKIDNPQPIKKNENGNIENLKVSENTNDQKNSQLVKSNSTAAEKEISAKEKWLHDMRERFARDMRRQMATPHIPDGKGTMLVPWKELKSIPTIIEYHRIAQDNVGDMYSSPFWYFQELNNNFIKYSIDASNRIFAQSLSKANRTLPIIVGGGGLVGCLMLWDDNQRIMAHHSRNVIGWGIGFNVHKDIAYKGTHIGHLKKFKLLGIRDAIPPYRWVPCVSAMHHGFDSFKAHPIVRKYGFVVHTKYSANVYRVTREIIADGEIPLDTFTNTSIATYIEKNGHIVKETKISMQKILGDWKTDPNVNSIKNNDMNLMDVLEFLAGSEVVITTSYHAMYWGTLLGRKVILAADFSSKFEKFPWPVQKHSGDLDWDVQQAKTYPEALEQSRQANTDFWEDVKKVLLTSFDGHYKESELDPDP